VDVPGVLAGLAGQTHDGVAMDTDEPLGLTDPIPFDQVLEDGDDLLRGQAGVGKRGALAFGEARLAGVAVEQSDVLVFAVAIADREVAGVTPTMEPAVGILAAETREVVHGRNTSREVADRRLIGRKPQDKSELGGPQQLWDTTKFPDFRQIAAIMDCSESTARKWAAKCKCRYILHEGKQRVFAEDVRGMTDERNAILAERDRIRSARAA
jgi:hypothetical protein